jgi:uncharacterized protein (TIGR02147 family)
MDELKEILSCTYQKRSSLNTQYSKNAFARDLGISPTALSQFLSGKRTFSNRNLNKIVTSLCLPTDYVQHLKNDSLSDSPAFELKMDVFSAISNWYHFAILNLTEIEIITSTFQIARRLGIAEDLATKGTKRLIKLGLLKKEKGVFSRTHKKLDAGTDFPSEALRKHNREKMELAIESLQSVPLTERDISSLTVTFDPNNIDVVKKEIRTFKKRISKICNSQSASEVYSLNIQFYPISKKRGKK